VRGVTEAPVVWQAASLTGRAWVRHTPSLQPQVLVQVVDETPQGTPYTYRASTVAGKLGK